MNFKVLSWCGNRYPVCANLKHTQKRLMERHQGAFCVIMMSTSFLFCKNGTPWREVPFLCYNVRMDESQLKKAIEEIKYSYKPTSPLSSPSGWICPRCGTCYAPWWYKCECNKQTNNDQSVNRINYTI